MARNFSNEVNTLEEKQLATRQLKVVTTVFILVTLIAITAGVYASMVGHNSAYGVFREVPWGIIISAFAYMANMATGLCLIAVIGHAYGLTAMAPLGPRAVYLSIVAIVAAFMLFGLGIENPWRMLLYNATSPNLTSNIWWMTTLYGTMSGCLFLKFSFQVTNRPNLSVSIGIIGAVAGVGANNNLGGLFTVAADPPIWYGFQLLIFFLASAVMTGAACIILFTFLAHKIRKQRLVGENLEALQTAGTIMAMMLAILLVIIISRYSTMFFSETPEPGLVAVLALLQGPLAVNFWVAEILVGIVIPLVILVVTKIKDPQAITVAGCLALLGAFFQRYDLVQSGQIVPKFSGWTDSGAYLHYLPSFPEYLVVLGGFSLLGAGFLLGERFIGRIFRYY